MGKPVCFFVFLNLGRKEGIDGIEIGQILREEKKETRAQIVYVSGFPSLAYEGINNDIIGFINKGDFNNVNIERILERGIKRLEKNGEAFLCHIEKEKRAIPYRSILYFYKEGRRVGMRIQKGEEFETLWLAKTLRQVSEQLGEEFLQISGSYIIHKMYGMYLGKYEIKMIDGEILKVGPTYRKNYWGL